MPFGRIHDRLGPVPDGEDAMTTLVLHGEGAYEGLVAVLRLAQEGDWRGSIVAGEIGETPENAFEG